MKPIMWYYGGHPAGREPGQIAVITLEERTAEIDRNYQAFKELMPKIILSHAGEYALLRNREVIDYFNSASEAFIYAEKNYPDGVFSIQKVTDEVVDLGYFSHVENSWNV